MAKQQNPGVPEGTEIVFLAKPFGGWSQTLSGTNSTPHFTASVEGIQAALAKQSQNNYAESDGITLFRREKLGHIAPGQVFAGLTNSNINELPLNGVKTALNNNQVVSVLNNGRLIQLDASALTYTTKYDPTSHTPIASASPNNDIIIFRDLAGSPIEYVVWSWEYSGGAEVSIIKASDILSNSTDGWYSGIASTKTLVNGVPHKLCTGPDGNIYVTDGAYVQQINVTGALGSAVVGNLLPIGTGWTAQGIVSYKNYVAVIASSQTNSASRGQTRVFLWNGQTSTVNGVTSTAPQYIFDIPDNFGNGLFFDGTILYALTNGRNATSKIFEFTGKDFKQVFESGLLGTSATPNQGNLESYQSSLMIGGTKNSQAHLFRFYANGFHDEGVLTDGTNSATSIGMVKNFYLDTLLVGVKYGSTFAFFNGTNTNYQTNAVIRTILFTEGILGRRLYPLGFKGTVNRIQIFLSQWGTGASLTLSLFKDYTTSDLLNRTIDTTTYPSGTTEIDITDIALPDISSFYMTVTFSHASTSNTAAIIRSMVVFWAPSQ